ncbi:MAG: GNAT family N-acetyltransferase [Candidatus Bipolaricaulota bacterium]
MRIREATQADDRALLNLEAVSPQGDSTRILLERTTYFYRPTVFDRGKVMVAEEDGRLVGIMSYAIKDVWLAGEVRPVAYVYDLRSDPGYRRSMKRGLFHLWKALEAEIGAHGARLTYGHIKEDNQAAMRVLLKGGLQRLALFGVRTLPAVPAQGPLPPACRDPLEGAARVEELVGKRNLRPVSVVDCYRKGLELGYLKGVYRLEHGRSFAQASVWDLSGLYRGRVLRLPVQLRLLGATINPLSSLLPLPRIPRVGEPVNYWHCFDAYSSGRSGKRLMRELVQGLRRMAAHAGTDILTLFYYIDEPLLEVPQFLVQKTMRYHTLAQAPSEALPRAPLYLDVRDL